MKKTKGIPDALVSYIPSIAVGLLILIACTFCLLFLYVFAFSKGGSHLSDMPQGNTMLTLRNAPNRNTSVQFTNSNMSIQTFNANAVRYPNTHATITPAFNNKNFNAQQPVNQPTESVGYFLTDLPIKLEKDKPFDMDIWFIPHDPQYKESVKVYMEQTTKVKYNPRVFTLKPRERKTINVNIVKTYSGLVVVAASAEPTCDILEQTIDAGFSAKLKTNIDGPIEGNLVKSFSIAFVDNQGNRVPMDANLTLTLQASKLRIRQLPTDDWADKLVLDIKANSSSTPVVEIKPETWFADTGVISAEIKTKGYDFVIHDENIWINIQSRWYIPLLMAIFGGMLHSFYEVSKKYQADKIRASRFILSVGIPGFVTGALAGTLAYLLASWGVLGIKVDTTTIQGFIILGFLFSYVGIDLILKTVTQQKEKPDNPPAVNAGNHQKIESIEKPQPK